MRCECVYCEILYNVKEPFEDDSVSHGMCEECSPIVLGNLERELSLRAGVPSRPEAQPRSSSHSSGGARNLNPATGPIETGPFSRMPGDAHGINAELTPNRVRHGCARPPG